MQKRSPGALDAALRRRGYSFRQHRDEVVWTQRTLTVVDLDRRQRAALEGDGVAGLKRVLDEQGLWSFPATDIREPLRIQRDVILAEADAPRTVVVAPASGMLRQMAKEFISVLVARAGVRLSLLEDTEADPGLLRSQHVIVFGGSHESRFAMDLALRYQSGFVDGTVPGEDGWVVTTHVGLDKSGYNVVQVTASPSHREAAMACLSDALVVADKRAWLRATHRIRQGADMRAHFPAWDKWVAQRAGGGGDPMDPVGVADRIAVGLDSGGPAVGRYNSRAIDTMVESAQYYQRSADIRALQLFRELLFRLADYYLETPEGASYPSDLDFRLGHLILYYSRLEHEPTFSDEDRLIFANLLLACTRSIHEYTVKIWPLQPGVATRHNHETFAARSLMYAADYFERYEVADVSAWRARVEDVFAGELWTRYKQKENANLYETFAYEHAAAYSAFTAHGLNRFDREALRLAARRHVIATDNFFRPVDYGDTGVAMGPGGADKLALIFTSQYKDSTLQWFAAACFDRERSYLPRPLDSFTDLRRPYRGPAPKAGGWEFLPLDPRFAASVAPDFPPRYTFDKLAFRSGWDDEAHYLLFEGVGNQKVSHSHNNVNGIVRLNHLGRHLLVSNGYGKQVYERNVTSAKAFSGRVRGPEDHNNLVLRRGGEIVRELPVCSALLQQGQSGELAYATGALLGYGGLDWFRTLVVLSGRFVLSLDRIRAGPEWRDSGHVEWNCPGEVDRRANGFRVSQEGVYFDVTSASGWQAEQGVSDRSASWKNVLESGAYPHAKWPLKKLVYNMPSIGGGGSASLTVLLAATREAAPRYRISEPKPGLVMIEAVDGGLPVVNVDDNDLSIRGGGGAIAIRFAAAPELPSALRSWAANE